MKGWDKKPDMILMALSGIFDFHMQLDWEVGPVHKLQTIFHSLFHYQNLHRTLYRYWYGLIESLETHIGAFSM